MTLAMELEAGLHNGIPLEQYRAIDAIGSGRLEWLAVSPMHYRYMVSRPEPKQTDAELVGSALHMAVLEPTLFQKTYVPEPDPEKVAPDNAKPRATNLYKAAVAGLEAAGLTVLRSDTMAQVAGMATAILSHPHAAALLKRAPEREVTAIWERNGHRCRGRFDMLGPGVIGDIKTTRRLRDFSPWTLTRLGYYRQAGWYRDGANLLDRDVEHFFFIAVENTPPYDVGVFALEPDILDVGMVECGMLLERLGKCERENSWPGMYPDVQTARLSDAVALQLPDPNAEED